MNKHLLNLKPAAWLLLATLLAGWLPQAAAQTKSPKRGLAYDLNAAADMQALAPGISWWYNWASKPGAGVVSAYPGLGVEYVPMQWNQLLNNATVTADQLAANIPAGAKYLLGFNEPNFVRQANLTPKQAAALWPVLQEVARRKGLKLVSPAVNYCGECVSENGVTYYTPTQYLDAFFAACPNCQVDYIAVHTYVCQAQYLRDKIGELKKYNKPLWLTEFSCGDMPAAQITLDVQKKYLTDAVAYLESEPAVFRYSWFSGRNSEIPNINLLGATGQLTELGKLYVSLPFGAGAAAATTLEAENYSNMKGVQVESTSDTGSGQDVGYIDAGDWLLYNNISFPTSGTYTIEYRVASPGGGTLSADLNAGSIQLGKLAIPATGGWQTWRTISQTVTVNAGTYSFGINAQTGGWNINWLRISKSATSARGTAGSGAVTNSVGVASELELYPNPATDRLLLRSANSLAGSQFRIVDAVGRLVSSGAGDAGSVDVSALRAGTYTLRLITKDQQRTSRQFSKQ